MINISSDTAKKSDLPTPKRVGESGYLGIKNLGGYIQEEAVRELRFPYNIKTFTDMVHDPVIYGALTTIKSFIKNLDWRVEAPHGASEEDKKRAELIEGMMEDMDRPWDEIIQEAFTSNIYGFSVLEKVFKRRRGYKKNRAKSSYYDDSLFGWSKLAPRSQDTIDKFIFSEDNRELLAIRQNLGLVPNTMKEYKSTEVIIPRDSFLLFRTDPIRDNPDGNSPLKGAYYAWKFKVAAEEIQAVGFSRDLRGLPVFGVPAEYLSEDATQDQKEYVESTKRIIRNLNVNEEAGIVKPILYDDAGKDMFTFELTNLDGGSDSSIGQAIDRYENKMLMAFMADVLKMGQDNTGSFALADSKSNLLSVGIDARLSEIADVFNKDLIPHTYRLNGWEMKNMPRVVYSDIEDFSLEELSKYIQRVVSVGAVEMDKNLSDKLRERIKLKPALPTEALDQDLTGNSESRAGDGMKTAGEGTSKGGGTKQDNSSKNLDNKA